MLGVGGLAALINVVVLITVAIADRAIELTVRNFAASSLQTRQRAPVVHDSDTWLPNLPRSIVKYHRHPAILFTVLCTILLIASELVTEFGVDVSDTCSPVKIRGSVIKPGGISGQITIVEKGASAFLLHSLNFSDGPLKRVPAGLPIRLRGNECLSCMDDDRKTYPDIVNHCTVTKSDTYGTGKLQILADGTGDSPLGNVTLGFKETSGAKRTFFASGISDPSGRISREEVPSGDITYNGKYYAAFVFFAAPGASPTDEVTYFEYFAQTHIHDLKERLKRAPKYVWETTTSNVDTWKIKCATNKLSARNFHTALSVFRTVQLENPVNPAPFNEGAMKFVEMKVEDVYRASLSTKVIDDEPADGEYFAYTTCGVYRWQFIAPMIISIFIVLGLGAVSVFVSPDKKILRSVPYNSRTWFRHAQTADDLEPEDLELQNFAQQYASSMTHEMFLLEFGESPGSVPQVGLRSKRKQREPEKVYEEPKPSPSGYFYSW